MLSVLQHPGLHDVEFLANHFISSRYYLDVTFACYIIAFLIVFRNYIWSCSYSKKKSLSFARKFTFRQCFLCLIISFCQFCLIFLLLMCIHLFLTFTGGCFTSRSYSRFSEAFWLECRCKWCLGYGRYCSLWFFSG